MSGEILPAIGDFPSGSQIAGYRVEQLIGRGGMATVYRATDERLDRQVALKVLTPELTRDDAFRQRFIRESRSGASVDHPNVIPVFEAGESQGVLFIAMRYVTGQDVRVLIEREGKLPPGRVVSIITQVASALDAAHAHGLIHRDVKPANMLLGTVGSATTPDHVYLSDFGLSKLSVSNASLTGTGQFLGTLDYMSPEQIEGRPIDGRTDLYALGCAAFEMLTGQPPFLREQNLAVMWAQVSAPPPSARELQPELPAAVDQVLARALAKAPENRQGSCLEFAAELKAACALRSAAGGFPAGAGPAQPARPGTELAFGPGAPGFPDGPGFPGGPGSNAGGPAGPGQGNYAPTAAVGMPPVGPISPGFDATETQTPAAGQGATGPGSGQPGSGGPPPSGVGPYGSDPGYGGGYGGGPGYYAQSGYQQGGPPSDPSGGTHQLWAGGQTGYQDPFQPTSPKRRGKLVPIVLVLVIVVAVAGAAVAVIRLHNNGGSPQAGGGSPTVTVTQSPSNSPSTGTSTSPDTSTSPSQSASPPPTTPAAVVTDYYNAINDHNYRAAWRLNEHVHSLESFAAFKQGFDETQNVVLTIVSQSGEDVSIRLTANQTDGTVKTFDGSYAVQNGTIVASSIEQTS